MRKDEAGPLSCGVGLPHVLLPLAESCWLRVESMKGSSIVRNDTYVEKLIDVSQSTKPNVMLIANDASW
jgi:hypothetical protein